MITKTETGKWRVDIRLATGVRKRKSFRTQTEAKQYLHFAKSQGKDSPWAQGQRTDKRKLSELAQLWYDNHGRSLESGADRKGRLLFVSKLMGDPIAQNLSPESFSEWRSKRLADGISSNTCNHDLAHLRALYNELERLGQIDYPNPLTRVRTLKVPPSALRTLAMNETRLLLTELDGTPAELVMRVCLCVGARWAEAQSLKKSDLIQPNLIRIFGKNNKYRFLPVDQIFFDRLLALPEEDLFPPTSYEQFRRAVERLKIELPQGQLTHVLRHTFATTYLRKTGDLKGLQVVLDHSNISVTSRYLHAMPDHSASVLTANPLADLLQS